MAHWHEGFDDIKVKLICFEGDEGKGSGRSIRRYCCHPGRVIGCF